MLKRLTVLATICGCFAAGVGGARALAGDSDKCEHLNQTIAAAPAPLKERLSRLMEQAQEPLSQGSFDAQLASALRKAATEAYGLASKGERMPEIVTSALAAANKLDPKRPTGEKAWKFDIVPRVDEPVTLYRYEAGDDTYLRNVKLSAVEGFLSANGDPAQVLLGIAITAEFDPTDARADGLKNGDRMRYLRALDTVISQRSYYPAKKRVGEIEKRLFSKLPVRAAGSALISAVLVEKALLGRSVEGTLLADMPASGDQVNESMAWLRDVALGKQKASKSEIIEKAELLFNFGEFRIVGSVRDGGSRYNR